jgi:hypothetical protein
MLARTNGQHGRHGFGPPNLYGRLGWRGFLHGFRRRESRAAARKTFAQARRMIGCAAEIDDHLNRGRNMDTRTPASECRFVA